MVVWRNNALLTDSLKRFSNSNKSSKSIKESSKKAFSVLQRRGAQISIKPCSVAENQVKKGGGQLGHEGVGRQVLRAEEAAEVRISEVLLENCPKCECRLLSQTSNERAIYDLQREEIRQIYSSRFIGSIVADFHRTLLRGGIFLYPATTDFPEGRLRLLYEANPIAFLAEQAGGAATDGTRPILDISSHELHQRTALIVSGKSEMDEFENFVRKNSAVQVKEEKPA